MRVAHPLLALLGFACLPSRSVDLPLAAGEIGVAAVLERGEPKAALLFTSDATVPLSFGEETRLFLWKLRPEDFVDSDGSNISPDELASVKVRFPGDTADPSRGSCGRCLAPWSSSPQPIFPGDSCDVPVFGELMVLGLRDGKLELMTAGDLEPETLEEAELLRRSLRIDWPGACACDDVALEGLPDARYDFLPPRSEAIDQWPFERWAIHPDGTVAGFREKRIVVIDPSGARRIFPKPAGFPEDLGSITSAVAITYGNEPAFVVAATSLDLITARPYYFLIQIVSGESGPELTARALSLGDQDFRPYRLMYVDESHFWMLGGTQDTLFRLQLASFFECSVEGTRIECALGGELDMGSCMPDDQRLADLARLGDGRLIGGLEQGGLIFGVQNGSNWTLSCRDDGAVEIAGSRYSLREAWTGGVFAFPSGRVFACTGAANERVLLTADFSSATTLDQMLAVEWTQLLVLPGHFALPCEDFVPGPGPDQITIVTSAQVAAVCTSTSASCVQSPPNTVTGSPPPNRLEQPVPGWTLASFFTDGLNPVASQLFRSREGGERELVYGPRELDRSYTAPLVLGADGYARWIRATDIVRFKRIGDDLVETSTTVIPSYNYHPFDAALDSSNGSYVVLSAVYHPEEALFGSAILRVWEEPPSFEVIAELAPLRTPECAPFEITFFTKLVETRPGELLAISECGWIARIAGDEVSAVRLENWDDPETATRETRRMTHPFRALTTSHGVAWIGGHFGSMVRVHGDRAERFSLERTLGESGAYENRWQEGLHVDAIRAFCPDRVLFASSHQQYLTSSPRRMFDDRRYQIEAGPFAFHSVDGKARRPEFNPTPREIVGPSEHYVILSNRAWSFQYQVPPVRALITAESAVEDRDNILWLGGSDRRLVLGTLER